MLLRDKQSKKQLYCDILQSLMIQSVGQIFIAAYII